MAQPQKPSPSATRRRRQRRRVLELAAQGLSNREIGRRVQLSHTWVAELIERSRPGGPKHQPED